MKIINPEEFYLMQGYPKMVDKHDMIAKIFDYHDLIDFAQQILDTQVKSNIVLGDVSDNEFREWLEKYFNPPKTKIMYVSKIDDREYSYEKAYQIFKRSRNIT